MPGGHEGRRTQAREHQAPDLREHHRGRHQVRGGDEIGIYILAPCDNFFLLFYVLIFNFVSKCYLIYFAENIGIFTKKYIPRVCQVPFIGSINHWVGEFGDQTVLR